MAASDNPLLSIRNVEVFAKVECRQRTTDEFLLELSRI